MTSFSDVTFDFVLLRFRLYAYTFVEAVALSSIVLQYAGDPTAPRVFFVFFGDVAFPEYFLYHFRFLFVCRVRRTSFPSEWCFFLPCDHGILDF